MLHFAAGQRCPLPIWQQGERGGGPARWDEQPHEKTPGNLGEGDTTSLLLAKSGVQILWVLTPVERAYTLI